MTKITEINQEAVSCRTPGGDSKYCGHIVKVCDLGTNNTPVVPRWWPIGDLQWSWLNFEKMKTCAHECEDFFRYCITMYTTTSL